MTRKLILLILLCNVFLKPDAQTVFRQPIIFQAYLGLAVALPRGLGIEAGMNYRPFWKVPVFAGVDYTKIYSTKKYNWPDVGDYKYSTRTECISPLLGFTFFGRRRVSLSLGLKYDFVTTKGKLLTENQVLKDYILNSYKEKDNNLSGFFFINGRLTEQFSTFFRIGIIHTENTNITGVLGAGITCNILSKKALEKKSK